jgi:hypothetical protein
MKIGKLDEVKLTCAIEGNALMINKKGSWGNLVEFDKLH